MSKNQPNETKKTINYFGSVEETSEDLRQSGIDTIDFLFDEGSESNPESGAEASSEELAGTPYFGPDFWDVEQKRNDDVHTSHDRKLEHSNQSNVADSGSGTILDFYRELNAKKSQEENLVLSGLKIIQNICQGELGKVQAIPRGKLNRSLQRGNTALHFAAKYGKRDIVEYLITQNVDVNKTNDDNETALHLVLTSTDIIDFADQEKVVVKLLEKTNNQDLCKELNNLPNVPSSNQNSCSESSSQLAIYLGNISKLKAILELEKDKRGNGEAKMEEKFSPSSSSSGTYDYHSLSENNSKSDSKCCNIL